METSSKGAALRVASPGVACTVPWHRPPWGWLRVALPLAVAVGGAALGGLAGAALGACGALAAAAAGVQWLVGRGDVAWSMTASERGAILITGGQMLVERGDEEEWFSLSEVEGGWIEGIERPQLVLQLRAAVVRVALAERTSGERVLERLALLRDPRAVVLRLGTAGHRDGSVNAIAGWTLLGGLLTIPLLPLLPLSLIGLLKGDLSLVPLALLLGPAIFLLYRGIWGRIRPLPRVLRIGSEGVEIVGLRGRWIAFDDLKLVLSRDGSLVFRVRGGEEIRVPTASEAEAAAVVDRIKAAQAWMERAGAAEPLSELERRGRPLGEWLGELRALSVERSVGYRSAPVDPEALARVAEDPTAPIEQRVGAAYALGASGARGPAAERVRAAAQATAGPRLRVALEQASQGELAEDELTAALEEAERRERQEAGLAGADLQVGARASSPTSRRNAKVSPQWRRAFLRKTRAWKAWGSPG